MALPKPPLKPATRLDMSDIPTPKVRRATKKAAKKAAPVATETTVDQAFIREDHSSITKAAEMVKADSASSPHKKASTEVTTPVPTKVAVRKASRSVAQKQSKTATKQKSEGHKLFILDTNVLLHDPTCLFRFEEHDIFLPMMALEELDHNKKGLTEVARNARQVSRTLDSLVADHEDLNQGVPLNSLGNKEATGQLFFETQKFEQLHQQELAADKPDNIILNVVQSLKQTETQREVILVSKDINMRLKAKALGLASEDYLNDHSLEDSDLVYDGVLQLPNDFWQRHGKDMESWIQGGTTFYKIKGPLCAEFLVNQFVYLEGDSPLYAQVKEVTGKTAVLATVRDYTHKKNNVWGVTARNREQNFALNLLMSPEVDFVSLLGQAGTGKTLLALAAGLTQVLETKRYTEIIMTRVTVPVGEDIGFLPGTEEEKMQPWMGALEDNLEFLHSGNNSENLQEWDRSASKELIHSHIKVRSLNFMRGRTFLNKFVIIDEAQNLTPKQMKTLITRAGPGTKIICLGNIAQIDTPYLTEGSSGLTYVVDRFKHWPHSGHVTLQKGERSRLADYASDVL
ncbi:PhoH family protein [Oligella urethralis]|uniref:Phosphate starvation protein PhoH n=1 Tax=Oligella urethralis DNF00040 TaxID=1401065 RepID=A0A096BDS5_9BURK|nr:PhoH family protein [Oligella urethralis]KGF31279.1 phosphate starvation protein PhoH [Oligella urethralis DNF00040]